MVVTRFLITTLLLFNLIIVSSFADKLKHGQQQSQDEEAVDEEQNVKGKQQLQHEKPVHIEQNGHEQQQPQSEEHVNVERNEDGQQQPQSEEFLHLKQQKPKKSQKPQPKEPVNRQQPPKPKRSQQPQNVNPQQQPQQPQQPPQQPQQPPQQPQQPPQQPIPVTPKPINPGLKLGYYQNSCPQAEKIVAEEVSAIIKNNPLAIAAFIRMVFHDCFVHGCDASLLLDTTDSGQRVEKFASANGELLRGTDYIDDIKGKLELVCPGIVSCADIMSFAAFEALAIAGGPRRPALGGRKDGTDSLASQIDVDQDLPLNDWTMDQVLALFARNGFTVEDTVALNGAHTVGVAHCSVFKGRDVGYGATVAGPQGTVKEVKVDVELAKMCKPVDTPEARYNPAVSFDQTPTVFDNLIFKEIVEQGRVILTTDRLFATDPRTVSFVRQFAQDEQLFKDKFADAYTRLSTLDVLVGNQGQVRNICRSVN